MTITPQLNKFGLTPRDMSTIEDIFKNYPTIEEVYLFGSRAKGNYKLGSDIDLSIMNKSVTNEQLMKLKADFTESSLPYEVDVVLYEQITNPDFIQHINRVGIPFYKKESK